VRGQERKTLRYVFFFGKTLRYVFIWRHINNIAHLLAKCHCFMVLFKFMILCYLVLKL
jgi:hypothetical protein